MHPVSPNSDPDIHQAGEGPRDAEDTWLAVEDSGVHAEEVEINVDEVQADETREDVEAPKFLCSPCSPSALEIEQHRCSHIPYRNWCKHCVMGRATGLAHTLSGSSESSVPIVGLDYFFVTAGGIVPKGDLKLETEAASTA